MNQNISQSKQHLECIFDAITNPIFTINADYTITRLNKRYAALVGKSFREIIGKPCYSQLYKRSSPCLDCPLDSVLQKDQRQEVKICPDDKTIYNVDCFPLKEKDGTIIAMVEVIRNITDEERIRKELADLQAQTLDKSVQLAGKNKELEQAYIKISQELKLAQLVQRGIMPQTLPEATEIDTAIFYLPMEEVGGDLYDFIQITPDMLGVILVDVSGHGIPAAFIAAMAKMSFYLHASDCTSTARVLSQVNQDMCDNLHTDEYFFTTAFCLIDFITNKVKYSNAGHPPLLILRKETKSLEEIHEKSIIMGLNADAKYYETEIDLKKGDRLVFFTDGIYECINEDKALGFNYFCDVLLKTVSYTVSGQVAKIKEELAGYLNYDEPADDITLVIIEIAEENKFNYFKLAEHFAKQDKVIIQAVRHPLEFEKAISTVLHTMDTHFYHDQAIRDTKYAMYEALNIYYHSGTKSGNPIYFAYSCTKKRCTIVIVDIRLFLRNEIPPYFQAKENEKAVEIIIENMDKHCFFDGGRKIILEKYNN